MAPSVPKALLTGQSIDHKTGIIYQIRCPECAASQWHYRGVTTCLYCDQLFSVSTFTVINNTQLPVKTTEE